MAIQGNDDVRPPRGGPVTNHGAFALYRQRVTSWFAIAAVSTLGAAGFGCGSSGDFDIIWTRPAPPPIQGECSARHDALYATRIGLNRDSLAVDLRLEEGAPGDREARWRGGAMVPRVQLLVNGCLARAPRVKGRMLYGGPDARIVISRRDLPNGELTLTFEAFDREDTILLVNDGNRFDTVTSEEHSRWVERPADPRTGEEAVIEYWAPDCDDAEGNAR